MHLSLVTNFLCLLFLVNERLTQRGRGSKGRAKEACLKGMEGRGVVPTYGTPIAIEDNGVPEGPTP